MRFWSASGQKINNPRIGFPMTRNGAWNARWLELATADIVEWSSRSKVLKIRMMCWKVSGEEARFIWFLLWFERGLLKKAQVLVVKTHSEGKQSPNLLWMNPQTSGFFDRSKIKHWICRNAWAHLSSKIKPRFRWINGKNLHEFSTESSTLLVSKIMIEASYIVILLEPIPFNWS